MRRLVSKHDGHEIEQTLGDSEGWRILVHFSPWDYKELDTALK